MIHFPKVDTNEREKHEEFERICGGPERAFRLMRIWQNTSNPLRKSVFETDAEREDRRVQNFRNIAQREGYTRKQIVLFLNLQ